MTGKQTEKRLVVRDSCLGCVAWELTGLHEDYSPHFHEYYSLGLLLSGQRKFRCRGRWRELIRGQMLIIPPGLRHECRQSGRRPMHFVGLNIPVDSFEFWSRQLEDPSAGFVGGVSASCDLSRALLRLHRMIMTQAELRWRAAAMRSLLGAVGTALRLEPQAPESSVNSIIREVCVFMHEHCGHELKLDDLCSRFRVSKSWLMRHFKASTSLTPHAWLISARLALARSLLDAGLKPGQAALEAGFADQSHFNRQFKSTTGLTPGLYALATVAGMKDSPQCRPIGAFNS